MPKLSLTSANIEFIKTNRLKMKRSKAMVDVGQVLVNLAKEEIAFNKMKFQYGEDFAGKAGKFFDGNEQKKIG